MRYGLAGVILSFLLACHLVAAPPKVPDPLKVAVGDDVVVEIQAEQGKVGAFREGFDVADCLFVRLYSSDESRMMFLCRPKKAGRFFVVFWSVGEAASSRLEIVAGGAGPKPPVDPDPPAPPVTGPLYVVVVEETDDAVWERAKMLTDPELIKRFKEKGHKRRIVDQDAKDADGKTPSDLKPYFDRAKGKPLPYVFFVAPDGTVRGEGAMPKTPAAFLDMLTKAGG